MMVDLDDLMGPAEVAAYLGVQIGTVYAWKYRGRLPRPDVVLTSTDLWLRPTIDSWARATGRMEPMGVMR